MQSFWPYDPQEIEAGFDQIVDAEITPLHPEDKVRAFAKLRDLAESCRQVQVAKNDRVGVPDRQQPLRGGPVGPGCLLLLRYSFD